MAGKGKGVYMTAKEWNKKNPIGTKVKYWPVADSPEYKDSETRSEAWSLGDGHAVVLIKGQAGGVSLNHLITQKNFDEIGKVHEYSGS